MSTQAYLCDICLSPWKTAKAADDCAKKHYPKESFTVGQVFYAQSDWNTRSLDAWPKTIKVENASIPGPFAWNYAIYELKHVGPRGA